MIVECLFSGAFLWRVLSLSGSGDEGISRYVSQCISGEDILGKILFEGRDFVD